MLVMLRLRSIDFYLFFSTLVLLAITNNLAVYFYLYWIYPWIDIPVHFLGGLVVVFGLVWFVRCMRRDQLLRLWHALLFIIVIATIWELYEYLFGISLASDPDFVNDTVIDYIFGIFGGLTAWFIGKRLSQLDDAV